MADRQHPAAPCLGFGDPWLSYNPAAHLALYRFQPGVSANPGGRPKVDVAAELARTVIEENFEAIKAAFSKVLKEASPYAFQVLSDRAYRKLKETHAIEPNPYKHLSDEELEARIKELEQKLVNDLGYLTKGRAADPAACGRSKAQLTGLYIRCASISLCISVASSAL